MTRSRFDATGDRVEDLTRRQRLNSAAAGRVFNPLAAFGIHVALSLGLVPRVLACLVIISAWLNVALALNNLWPYFGKVGT